MDETVKSQKTDDVYQPPPSVGTVNKESGTAVSYIEHSEPEPKIAEEVKDFIKPSEKPVPEHLDIGIRPAAEATPVRKEPSGNITLPMTEDEAKKAVKEGMGEVDIQKHFEGVNFAPARLFLATLVLKVLKLKGKFVR